jgi:hypothetical protein
VVKKDNKIGADILTLSEIGRKNGANKALLKEIQSGEVEKSYMRRGFLIQYMRKCANISPYMRTPFVIYDFATVPF